MTVTPSIGEFYAPARQGRAFGVWARDYTIALAPNGGGFHIGQDYTTGRRPLEVPAILGGEVVRVRWAEEVLGSVVVLRCGWGKGVIYVSYCHLSKERLPQVGQWIPQAGRVGRLAAGPNARTATRNNPAVAMAHAEWPGTGWDGIHLHLVIGNHPDSAYSKVAGQRSLSSFLSPAVIIASIMASPAGGGSRPFDPEEDDLNEKQDFMLNHLFEVFCAGIPERQHMGLGYAAIVEGRANAVAAYGSLKKIEPVVAGPIERAGEMGGTTSLAAFLAWADQNNIATRRVFVETGTSIITEIAKSTGVAVDEGAVKRAIEAAIADTSLDPAVIAKAVNDDADDRERRRLGTPGS